MENAIVQLNKYPKDKYNVLVPVTTMQVASNLQRITVSEVQLDVRAGQLQPRAEQGHLLRKVQQRLCHHQGRRHEAGCGGQHQHRGHRHRADRGLPAVH